MIKNDANSASLKLNKELLSLNVSAVLSLYTIDLSQILFENGLSVTGANDQSVFRFHNELKGLQGAKSTSIWFQGNEFIACPINVQGYEVSSKGTLPQPKLSLCVDDTNISTLTLLKEQIFKLGDLTGVKVVRQRTLAKFIDARNFLVAPADLDPDPNVEFGRDIYFIERKSLENKYTLEFELSSSFDVQGIQIPARTVAANKCLFSYRGEGCVYEYQRFRTSVHGKAILPDEAPPFFNVNDELISDVIQSPINVVGQYDQGANYNIGDAIFVEKNGLKYWFVCKISNPLLGPPNQNYWIAEQCSHNLSGCKIRYDLLTNNRIKSPFPPKTYPFGGFPGARKVAETQ